MTVSAVCCSRFGSGSVVVSPITQRFIKLCVDTALQALRYRFPEQPLDILHPSNIRVAQQLPDQLSSCLFLRCSFSAHFFSLHSFAFIIHCLWSLHKIWGGLQVCCLIQYLLHFVHGISPPACLLYVFFGSFFFFAASASPSFHRMVARASVLSYFTAPSFLFLYPVTFVKKKYAFQ